MSRPVSILKAHAPVDKHGAPAHRREVPAVRRSSALLWLLARHPEGLSLSRIAREIDTLTSTCLHILRELAAARLVAYDPNAKLYRLGNGILSLARELTKQNPFVQLAQPHLNKLSRELEVGASAQERDGDDDMLVVAAASVMPGDMVSAGGRTPLLTSASGRVIAAYGGFTDEQLRERFARLRWQDPPDIETWLADVRATKGHRHATDEGRFRKGITAIACGIFDADGSVGRTISVTVVSAQLDPQRRQLLIDATLQAGADINASLR
jgi:DNA-binding IclR family transcriptional regulator